MRIKRHCTAMQKLNKETDFFQFLKLARVAQFMSKVTLHKYQRDMLPYFKKYQLTALQGDECIHLLDTSRWGETAHKLLEGDQNESVVRESKRAEIESAFHTNFDV